MSEGAGVLSVLGEPQRSCLFAEACVLSLRQRRVKRPIRSIPLMVLLATQHASAPDELLDLRSHKRIQ